MTKSYKRLKELYERMISNTSKKEELEEFVDLANLPENEMYLRTLMEETYTEVEGIEKLKVQKPKKPDFLAGWKKWAVAAAALLILVSGYWFLVKRSPGSENNVAVTPSVQDVSAPHTTRATITLADGRIVSLDSLTTVGQGGVNVIKNAEGEVVYQGNSLTSDVPLTFNTLYNPRGSKAVSLTLSDGTRVWLNAESSLRYPVAFIGDERRVEIKGEGYFEVSSQSQKGNKIPFLVDANGALTEVLGTSFNVNAYGDDEAVKVTLLEGSVKVSNLGQAVILKPGQQALSSKNQAPGRINLTNTDEILAWKNGLFHFESAGLKTILKEFERWYDIEVIYEGEVSKEKYFAIMNRSTNLSDVLKSLQANDIRFRIEGKKLFVING